MVGEAVEHENFFAVVVSSPQGLGCFVLLLGVAGDLVQNVPKLYLFG